MKRWPFEDIKILLHTFLISRNSYPYSNTQTMPQDCNNTTIL